MEATGSDAKRIEANTILNDVLEYTGMIESGVARTILIG